MRGIADERGGEPVTDQATSSIGINATPAQIVAVIADFDSYPQWAGYITAVAVLSHGEDGRPEDVHFVLDAGVVKADYTLRYTWEEAEDRASVKWTLQSGSLKRNDGSYEIRETDNASEVVYALAVDLGVPMLGLFRRKAEKVIMDTALTKLKRRVEKS
jgi:ribosome-associated toxin RatA of RatAB toxin-antitoxin module